MYCDVFYHNPVCLSISNFFLLNLIISSYLMHILRSGQCISLCNNSLLRIFNEYLNMYTIVNTRKIAFNLHILSSCISKISNWLKALILNHCIKTFFVMVLSILLWIIDYDTENQKLCKYILKLINQGGALCKANKFNGL